MRNIIFHIVFLCFCAAAAAQEKTVLPDSAFIRVQEVDITTDYTGRGYKKIQPDSLQMKVFRGKSLADLLQNTGAVYVRQYAPGQLSTVSMRGSSASQVQVLWNGFNLNNLTLGQTDFSLVPVALFSSVSVDMGALGAMGGNGVVAGAIELDSRELLEKKQSLVRAGIQAGSFGRYAADAAFSGRGTNNTFSVKPYYMSSAGDFTYKTYDGGQKKMQHAASTTYGGIASYGHRFKQSDMNTEVWLNAADREIPPTLYESRSLAEQQDFNLRFSVNHRRRKNGLFYGNRIGYFYDRLNYENPVSDENSQFRVQNLLGETESFWKSGKHSHKINLFFSGAKAFNTGYAENAFLLRGSAGYFFNARYRQEKKMPLALSAAIKEEVNNGIFSIPVLQFGMSMNYQLKGRKNIHAFQVSYNTGTVYRFPTLNDMYWSPGGNPALLPEKGISGNITAGWNMVPVSTAGLNFLKVNFTHYQRYMYDWIMWLPNGAFWSPRNFQEVWSRGNETSVHLQTGHHLKFFMKTLLNYTVSTIQESGIPNDMSIDRQLIYTPMYNATATAGITWKGFSVSADMAYYGYRYTSSDNYEYLDPFYILGAKITWTGKIKNGTIDVFADGANLLNETYYWLAQRPALPRNINVGVAVKWVKQKHENK